MSHPNVQARRNARIKPAREESGILFRVHIELRLVARFRVPFSSSFRMFSCLFLGGQTRLWDGLSSPRRRRALPQSTGEEEDLSHSNEIQGRAPQGSPAQGYFYPNRVYSWTNMNTEIHKLIKHVPKLMLLLVAFGKGDNVTSCERHKRELYDSNIHVWSVWSESLKLDLDAKSLSGIY